MTNHINHNEVKEGSGEAPRRKRQGTSTWQMEDAARFFFKAQCYDAGPNSRTSCGLCGEHIRLCYVLKVLEVAEPLAPEVGKLTIGECCFTPIKAENEKLYRQLLAAAINLRTFLEAVERDKRIFAGSAQKVALPEPLSGTDEEVASESFESLATNGGDHV